MPRHPILPIAAALTVLVGASGDRLSLKVNPAVLYPGAALWITCHVPRDAANRWLEIGLADYTSHGVQLDGDRAAVTHRQLFEHVGCTGPAYCRVTDASGHQAQAVANVTVVGCDDGR